MSLGTLYTTYFHILLQQIGGLSLAILSLRSLNKCSFFHTVSSSPEQSSDKEEVVAAVKAKKSKKDEKAPKKPVTGEFLNAYFIGLANNLLSYELCRTRDF